MEKKGGASLTSWVGWLIGALGLAGVAVVGVNMLEVAREVDERAGKRQEAAVEHGLRLLGEFAAGDLLSFAQWDEALEGIVWKNSLPWMRENLGSGMFPDPGEQRLVVIDGSGKAVFASDVDGAPDIEASAQIVEAASAAMARAGALYRRALIEDLYLDDRYGDGLYFGIYAHAMARIGGVPSLVVAAPLVGETEAVDVPDRPVMLVDIQPLTPELMERLGALAHLDGVALVADGASPAGPVHVVADADGNEVARVTWSHRASGAAVLRSAAPALGLSVLVFLALSLLVSHVLRRGARALAASEQAALHASRHDAATGLANRGWFLAELTRLAQSADRAAAGRVVVFIDCDHFKTINDTLGHAAGDAVLVEIAGRLRGLGGRLEIAARLGGDEFAAVTAPLPSRDEREWLVAAIADTLAQPLLFAGRTIPVDVSIGAAELRAEVTVETLLARADMALYRAKRDGRGCLRMYDPVLDGPAEAPGQVERRAGRAAA